MIELRIDGVPVVNVDDTTALVWVHLSGDPVLFEADRRDPLTYVAEPPAPYVLRLTLTPTG